MLSNILVKLKAALLEFPPKSEAVSAKTSTTTSPFPAGVIRAVYTDSLTETNPPAAPFVTVMSLTVNPVTFSLKVIVTGIGVTFVELLVAELITTVGFIESYFLVKVVDAVFPLPAAS